MGCCWKWFIGNNWDLFDTIENTSVLSGGQLYEIEGSQITVSEFNGNTWQATSSLTVSPGVISVDRDRIVSVSNSSGILFVYERNGNTWSQTQSFPVGTLPVFSVDIDNDRIIVGSPRQFSSERGPFENYDSNSGEATIYQFDGSAWRQEAAFSNELLPSIPGVYVGGSVSISGDVAVVSSNSSRASHHGTIFEYDGSSWNVAGEMSSSGLIGVPNDLNFSAPFPTVAVDGQRAAISSALAVSLYSRSGSTWSFADTVLELPGTDAGIAPDINFEMQDNQIITNSVFDNEQCFSFITFGCGVRTPWYIIDFAVWKMRVGL